MNLNQQNLTAYQKIALDREAQMLRRRWIGYVEKSLAEGDRTFLDFGEWCQSQGTAKPKPGADSDPWKQVEAAREAALRASQAEQPEPPSAA